MEDFLNKFKKYIFGRKLRNFVYIKPKNLTCCLKVKTREKCSLTSVCLKKEGFRLKSYAIN